MASLSAMFAARTLSYSQAGSAATIAGFAATIAGFAFPADFLFLAHSLPPGSPPLPPRSPPLPPGSGVGWAGARALGSSPEGRSVFSFLPH